MSTEQNTANFRRIIAEVWNKGDLAVLDEIASPDIDTHFLPPGLETMKRFMRSFREAFPDVTIAIEDFIAKEDRAVARMTMSGTHRGPFFTPLKTVLPPTGKSFRIQIIDIWRFDANGKWVECWSGFDELGLLEQLGGIPEAEQNSSEARPPTLSAASQG